MKALFFDSKPYEINYLNNADIEGVEKIFYTNKLSSYTDIDENMKNAQILSVFVESNLSKQVLEKFSDLKFIILRSVGYSHVDLCYCKEKGINIFNAPHYGDNSIAEYTFSVLLSAIRHIPCAISDIVSHNINDDKYLGIELFNKTIGIVGLGAIGKKVAAIAKGFNMNVLYYDVNKTDNYEYAPLDELCRRSDVISINCPLNPDTVHLFDKNRFEKVKKGAVIINTARGEIINTLALYEALMNKTVSFAALDVVECEDVFYENETNLVPIESIKENCFKNYFVTKKLMTLPNVVITPHIAYNTKEAKMRILEITVENLISSTKFTNGAKNLILI